MNWPEDQPAPLSHYEFYVLLALVREDAHPYKIKGRIWKDSLGSIELRDGTLYRLISKMCEEALIEIACDQYTARSDKPRLHYGITHHGRKALRHELTRIKHATELANSLGLYEQPVPTALDELLENLGQ